MLDENFLDAIYAIVANDEALAGLLARLASRFGCISSALFYGDRAKPAADIVLAHGVFDAKVQARYLEHYASIDPAPAAIAALPLGVAGATDRIFTSEEERSSRFLLEFYHPLGLYEALAAPIARVDGRSGILAVHRGNDRPSFTDEEIQDFGAIASHVARAVVLRSRFFATKLAAELRGIILDGLPAGVIAVERHGRLVEANAAARAILARGDGLALSRPGRIRAVDKNADGVLSAAIATASSVSQIVLVPRGDDHRPYALKISADPGIRSASWVIIRIAEGSTPPVDVESVLTRALGLSASSAAVTAALMRGEDTRAYAKRAGISENTVKFHLKSAFRATGTRRQSELVQLATATLRDLS